MAAFAAARAHDAGAGERPGSGARRGAAPRRPPEACAGEQAAPGGGGRNAESDQCGTAGAAPSHGPRQEHGKDDGGNNGGQGAGAAPAYDVFISYAHKDGKKVAAKLEAGLCRRGLRVWRDVDRLSVGGSMIDGIREGLARASHMVAVISPAYLERGLTMVEMGGMLFGSGEGRILPVLHGIRPRDTASRMPWLADTVMESWDVDPEGLMDRIARTAGGAGAGRRSTAESEGAGGTACPDPGRNTQRGRPPKAEGSRDAAQRAHNAMERLSRGARMSIPSDIGGVEIPRPEVGEIVSRLEQDDRIVLTGDKGSGKSAILCQLYDRLVSMGRRALLVRCDDFLRIDSPDDLDRMLGGGISILEFLGGAGDGPKTAFLFDSLDAVSRDAESMSLTDN